MNVIPNDDEVFFDNLDDDIEEKPRFGLITKLIILLLVLAMLATLMWPLLQTGFRRPATPTPTPLFLQEA